MLSASCLMPTVSYANSSESIDFMDVYCSEGCQWQAKECPVLGFKIMSALDKATDQHSEKLVYFRNTLVYGVEEVKLRTHEKSVVSVKNPSIKQEIEKIFPEIGGDFIAGINKVCGYEESVKKDKRKQMDKFYVDPIFVGHAKTHLRCVYGLDDYFPELNNKLYYSSDYSFYGEILYNPYFENEKIPASDWWKVDQKFINKFCKI